MMAGAVFYIFGLWRGDKEAKRKDEEIKSARDSAKHWEAQTEYYKNCLFAKEHSEHHELVFLRRENDSLTKEAEKLKKRYADELQKRLELAELVREYEQAREDDSETVERAETEVERGEESSCD